MALTDWQRRAWNVLTRGPVYQTDRTTPERLVLSAATDWLPSREMLAELGKLGVKVETRPVDSRCYEMVVIRREG